MEPWMAEYPTVATVNMAGLTTLTAWRDNLPLPQTDVQRTVMRRILVRIQVVVEQEMEKDPRVSDGYKKLKEACARAGIKMPPF